MAATAVCGRSPGGGEVSVEVPVALRARVRERPAAAARAEGATRIVVTGGRGWSGAVPLGFAAAAAMRATLDRRSGRWRLPVARRWMIASDVVDRRHGGQAKP